MVKIACRPNHGCTLANPQLDFFVVFVLPLQAQRNQSTIAIA
jgi:hypothetical protein